MMRKISFFLLPAILVLWACGGSNSKLQEIDLLPFGMSISVKAPLDTVIMASSLGDMQEVIISSKDTSSLYNMQIYSESLMVNDMATIVSEAKARIEADETSAFKRYVKETDNGFVYEYEVDGVIGYDFRYYRIQGVKKFTFQTALGIFHTEEAAVMMFDAVQE